MYILHALKSSEIFTRALNTGGSNFMKKEQIQIKD